MTHPSTAFSSLSPAERNLFRLMQSIRCGRIRNLSIRRGQPSFEAPMTVVQVLKLRPRKKPAAPARGMERTDFLLKAEVVELLCQIRAVPDGMIERLEIVEGLPILMELAQPATPQPSCIPAQRN